MKGVILAGGSGTRLYPATKSVSKQLLPVAGKPMIYYPISMAMLAGVKEVLIITHEELIPQYQRVLGNGEEFGISIEYIVQEKPIGLANGLSLAEKFVGDDNFIFLLGDNIVHGHGLTEKLVNAANSGKNYMFSTWVENPTAFGVIEHDGNDKITNVVEKPEEPKSNWASIGMYIFNKEIFAHYKNLEMSARGEYELPDLVRLFMEEQEVYVEKLGRGFVWFDAGTHENYFEANQYIFISEKNSSKKIACLEEIGLHNDWLSVKDAEKIIAKYKGGYYEYLEQVINEKK